MAKKAAQRLPQVARPATVEKLKPQEARQRKSERLVEFAEFECPGCNFRSFYELKDGSLECAKCHVITAPRESLK